MDTRSDRARSLVRTFARTKRRSDPTRLGWAWVGAVWVHLALFAVLATMAAPRPLDRRILTLVRLDPVAPSRTHRPPRDPPAVTTERFVQTSPDDRVDRPPEHPDGISAQNTAADRPSRAPVTSDRDGLSTPRSDGPLDAPGAPSLDRRDGDPDAALGNRPTGLPGHIPVGGGGGGALGDGASVASTRKIRVDGGPEDTAGSSGAPYRPAPRIPEGVRANHADVVLFRFDPVPVPTPTPEPSPSPKPVPPPSRTRIDSGGVESPGSAEPALPTDPAADVGTERIAAPGTADPVDELREALGFGPLDRSKLAPRPEWAGRMYQDGLADSSPQTTLSDAAIDWKTSIATEETPLGRYVARASAAIEARWRAADLDMHSRAIGVQGDVTVRYLIHPDGKTSDVHVMRSSGNGVLDQIAARSIPPRLDRFPRDLGKTPITHEVTLHYRNPSTGP